MLDAQLGGTAVRPLGPGLPMPPLPLPGDEAGLAACMYPTRGCALWGRCPLTGSRVLVVIVTTPEYAAFRGAPALQVLRCVTCCDGEIAVCTSMGRGGVKGHGGVTTGEVIGPIVVVTGAVGADTARNTRFAPGEPALMSGAMAFKGSGS